MCLPTQLILLIIFTISSLLTADFSENDVRGYEWPINAKSESNIPFISNDALSQALSNLQSINKSNSLTEYVKRIDSYKCGSNLRHHFYWAWHDGVCNGLGDGKWKESKGRVLGAALCSDMLRLKSFGITRRDGVAIDIGAHTGDSTIPMALLVNHTIAFDPSVSVYKSLQATAVLNHKLHIDTYNLGVSPTDSEIKFQWGKGYECNGGIAGDRGRNDESSWVTRKTVKLDAFLAKQYGPDILRKLAYIKIDVEGYDMVILQSLYPMLNKIIAAGAHLPTIQVEYFIEFKSQASGGKLNGKDVVQLFSTIANLPGNYSVYCTNQCNYDRGACATEALAENALTITSVSTATDGWQEATEVHFVTDKNRDVLCEDLMLVPHRHRSRESTSVSSSTGVGSKDSSKSQTGAGELHKASRRRYFR